MTNGTRKGVRGQRDAPAALSPGKDPVRIVQEAGRAPGPVWTGAENLAPFPSPRFDPRTVQPVASRYTDYATRPTCTVCTRINYRIVPVTNFNKCLRYGTSVTE
jgi:hypothetical protein